jgi:hypothetical protein
MCNIHRWSEENRTQTTLFGFHGFLSRRIDRKSEKGINTKERELKVWMD